MWACWCSGSFGLRILSRVNGSRPIGRASSPVWPAWRWARAFGSLDSVGQCRLVMENSVIEPCCAWNIFPASACWRSRSFTAEPSSGKWPITGFRTPDFMNDPTEIIPSHDVTRVIRLLRDQRVILDTDLAAIYGVQTRALNQAVKRNQDRFPADFMFELSREEILGISQSVISLGKLKFSKQARVRHIVPKLDA